MEEKKRKWSPRGKGRPRGAAPGFTNQTYVRLHDDMKSALAAYRNRNGHLTDSESIRDALKKVFVAEGYLQP